MTPKEMDELVERVSHALRHEYEIPPEDHYKHHLWIRAEMEEKRVRTARNEEIRRHVQKWGIIGVLTFVAGAVYQYFARGHQ